MEAVAAKCSQTPPLGTTGSSTVW